MFKLLKEKKAMYLFQKFNDFSRKYKLEIPTRDPRRQTFTAYWELSSILSLLGFNDILKL